eukprot:SM000078S22049  [mRNA]  locus=s78:186839:188560:- [translate_table: standard]
MLPMEQAADAIKRLDLPTAEEAQSLLDAAEAHVGRPVRVFRRPATLPADDGSEGRGKQAEAPVPGPAAAGDEEGDSFYDFTSEDYARITASSRREGQCCSLGGDAGRGLGNLQHCLPETRQQREQERLAYSSRISKASSQLSARWLLAARSLLAAWLLLQAAQSDAVYMLRRPLCMPDGLVLEAAFAPSDAVSVVHDTLAKCLATQQETFYLYTAPPKQRLTDAMQTLYDAGLAPGALVYFAHDPPPGANMRTWEERGPYLRQDIADLCDLHLQATAAKEGSTRTAAAAAGSDAAAEGESRRPGPEPGLGSLAKPASTKPGSGAGKPKWLKL